MKQHLLICLSIATCLIGAWSHANENDDTSKLTVKGEATIYKPADQVELNISVVTQDPDSKKAVQANNEKMRKVIDQLNAIGLTSKEYQTGQFNIQPIYRYPGPKEESKEGPTITHYEVNNSIQIKTQKLDLIEKIIGVAVQSGANRLNQLSFNLADPQPFRDEVIQLATKHAFADANSLAQAAQVRLVRVLELALDSNSQHYPVPRMMMAKAEFAAGSYEAPIEVGQVELKANVNVVFEIGSK